MPKIRHLAIKTKDPERLAKFYEEVFGMKCIHAEKSGALKRGQRSRALTASCR
jgi:predicted enzyme related to lactoylglutathione lyase